MSGIRSHNFSDNRHYTFAVTTVTYRMRVDKQLDYTFAVTTVTYRMRVEKQLDYTFAVTTVTYRIQL
jgi:hypothetical protein